MKYAIGIIGVTFLLLNACAIKPKYLSNDFTAPGMIAVLPMHNHTNDLDGPDMVRRLMYELLPQRGYTSLALPMIDEKLREHGITDGGQLSAVNPQELASWLGVDGLLFGDLLEFGYLNVGFYRRRLVQAEFRLVDARTGEKLWVDERTVSRKEITLDSKEARKAFAVGLAEKTIGSMLNVHLKREARECVTKILRTLPPY
ncbi:MAG: hypothetical protein GF384_00190 [Elusimicrobia bacterium]|nr:hypothetical protein [Elusimicrobiota bacterium]MBD3411515.1 hypothetical protein [Elusimicrobiota bacterium]